MALYGLRPVPEIQFADFIFPAFDQIVNELAKFRYRSGGEYACPMVIRTPVGGGIRGGHYHSQSPESHFIHIAGPEGGRARRTRTTRRACSSAPIRDPDPVLFFEPKRIYRAAKGEVPEGEYAVPLGQGERSTREGSAGHARRLGRDAARGRSAAREAAAEGIECEIIDLRTLWPLDIETIVASVKKTGRAVVVHEAPQHLRLRRGARRAHQGAVLPPPRGAARARDRVRHAVPVHARDGVPAARAPHPAGDPRGRLLADCSGTRRPPW